MFLSKAELEIYIETPESEANMLFYIEGGFARNICNKIKCLSWTSHCKWSFQSQMRCKFQWPFQWCEQRWTYHTHWTIFYDLCSDGETVWSHLSVPAEIKELIYSPSISSVSSFSKSFYALLQNKWRLEVAFHWVKL